MPRPDSQLMLEAAVRVFGSEGFHAASMTGIARAGRTTKPTLYARFGDKESLLDTALEYESALLIEHLFSAYDSVVRRPLSAHVTSDVRAIFDYARDRPYGFRLLFGPYANERVLAVRNDVIARIEARIVDSFLEGRGRRRESARPAPRATAAILAALCVATALRGAAAALDRRDDEQIVEATVAFILGALRGLLPPTPEAT